MKLKYKERHGSQVKKTYDVAQTPYQRLQQSPYLSVTSKRRLKTEYGRLNPAELKRQIERLQSSYYNWQLTTGPSDCIGDRRAPGPTTILSLVSRHAIWRRFLIEATNQRSRRF